MIVERIAVVGGGIGGLCATIALSSRGVRRRPGGEEPGVGRLRRRDHPACQRPARTQRSRPRRAGGRRGPSDDRRPDLARGRCTMIADNDGRRSSRASRPGNGITRPRLHRILQDAVLGSGADVRTGVTVTSLDDRATASTSSSATARRAATTWSLAPTASTRRCGRLLFGDALRGAATRGRSCWRYNLPADRGARQDLGVSSAPAGTAGFVPLADELMYMLTIEKPPEGAPVRLPRGGPCGDLPRAARAVRRPVAEHRELVVDDAAVVYRPVENVLVQPPWYRGRVVLIGDAAHARRRTAARERRRRSRTASCSSRSSAGRVGRGRTGGVHARAARTDAD